MIYVSEESTLFYEEIRKESREAITTTTPKIALDIAAAVLIWLFGKLVFIPVAEGIDFLGYPLPQIINLIILVALAVIVLKILVDVRRLIDGVAGYAAVGIGRPYDVSTEEVDHYRTALRGISNIIVVSLAYLLFVEYLSGIHPAISGVLLLFIVVWAIFTIWRMVQAVSDEIRRYTGQWAESTLEEA